MFPKFLPPNFNDVSILDFTIECKLINFKNDF